MRQREERDLGGEKSLFHVLAFLNNVEYGLGGLWCDKHVWAGHVDDDRGEKSGKVMRPEIVEGGCGEEDDPDPQRILESEKGFRVWMFGCGEEDDPEPQRILESEKGFRV
jgi:hypothetical protein